MMQATDLHKEVLRVRPFIQPALDHGGNTHDYVHIVDGIISGRLHLWPSENSAMITEFHDFPNKRYLHVFLAGGDLDVFVRVGRAARSATMRVRHVAIAFTAHSR